MEISFGIVHGDEAPDNFVREYWEALMDTDRMKMRFCNVEKPTLTDVQQCHCDPRVQCFYTWDNERHRLTADFMLENFTGKSAQIHFSMHPDNSFKYSLALGRQITDQMIDDWRILGTDEFYLRSIYGLTPESNRAALLYNLRVGFKKVAVLPYGILDRGKLVNAVIVIKTRG